MRQKGVQVFEGGDTVKEEWLLSDFHQQNWKAVDYTKAAIEIIEKERPVYLKIPAILGRLRVALTLTKYNDILMAVGIARATGRTVWSKEEDPRVALMVCDNEWKIARDDNLGTDADEEEDDDG